MSTTHELKIRGFPCNLIMDYYYQRDRKTFINFLRENKIFSRFYALFKLGVKWRKTFKLPIYEMKYFQEIDPEDFIVDAFQWHKTKEDFEFWNALSDKWYNFYNRH